MNWCLTLSQFLVSFLIEIGVLWLGYTNKIYIPLPNKVNDAGERLAYAVHCLFPMVIVLITTIVMVMLQRINPAVNNPLSGNENLIQLHKNIVTNTTEQLLTSAILMLVFAAQSTCSDMMIFLPLCSALFVIGRTLFVIGYSISPKYRSVGMGLNAMTNITLMCYICYVYYSNWVTNSTLVKTEL